MVKVKACPECGDVLSLSGILLHYRLWHMEKYTSFKAAYSTWKLDAKDNGTPRKSPKRHAKNETYIEE